MKRIRLIQCLIALVVACGSTALLRAADEPTPAAPKPPAVDREKLRQELQNLPPEERRKKLQELREQRQQLTPEQREAQRKQALERLDKRLAELQKKKADGTITEQETKQLERLEQMKKRREQGPAQGAQPRRRPQQGEKAPLGEKSLPPEKKPAAPAPR